MNSDTPAGNKGKRHKKNSKKKGVLKDIHQDNIQPKAKDEGNDKKIKEKYIKHSLEEDSKPDVNNSIEKREKGEIQSNSNNETVPVKLPEALVETLEEEKIQTSVSKEIGKSTEQGPAFSLIEMLKHKSEKVRRKALDSLLKIGDKSMCYAFVSCIKDESFQVRLGALRGLYRFGGDLAADYLIKALDDAHADVRRRAVIYLGWLRKKELVPYITGALADTSHLVRKVATYTLGDVKDISAVPHLIKALDDTDQEVRKGALAALKRITKKSFDSTDTSSPGEINRETIAKWQEWWQNAGK